MNVLIVEDETAASENLTAILREIDPTLAVVANTEGVTQTVQWLNHHPQPDLIFMDIHLSDGLAFSIFDLIEIEAPIIFTTAYDEYAIQAFKVNSIDYLLKPIKVDELKGALHKFGKQNRSEIAQYLERLINLAPRQQQKNKLLVPVKDKLVPVRTAEIACVYTTDKNTTIYLRSGKTYPYAKTLEQLLKSVNNADFFRANKQFIVARDSITDITIWFDNRLRLSLEIESPEPIFISKNKASEFKEWMVCK